MREKTSTKCPGSTRGSRRNPPRARRRRVPRNAARKQKPQRQRLSERLQKDRERNKIRRAFKHLKTNVFNLFTRKEVEEIAKECGFYIRKPKEIRAFEFAICCALSSVVEMKRGFASVWRMLAAAAGVCVARSAVTQRFGKGSATLLELLYERAVERLPQWKMEKPEILDKLKRFQDVLADDGCVVRLSPLLGKLFPASRTNVMDAALKVHARADLMHRVIINVVVTGELESERDVARDYVIQPGTLYIRDLGYECYDDYAATIEMGSHILMRLKDSANPVVEHVRHGVRAPVSSEGKKLNEIEFPLSHDTFDLDARFPTSVGSVVLRVVGHYNEQTQKYHCYVTDLAPEEFSVEEIETLYSLRWIIELLFKLLKSSCHLDHVDTSDADAMRTHIYASLLASIMLSAVVVAAAKASGKPASEISILTVGIAAPLLAVPLLLLWLGRKITHDELASVILRLVAFGCCDQNRSRTKSKWGQLS